MPAEAEERDKLRIRGSHKQPRGDNPSISSGSGLLPLSAAGAHQASLPTASSIGQSDFSSYEDRAGNLLLLQGTRYESPFIQKIVEDIGNKLNRTVAVLANVRGTSKEPSGLVRLQRQLLLDILKGKKVKISNVDERIINESKIIITTNEQLLKAHELHKWHGVKGLTEDESFQLFSWHAFGQDHPIEGYMEHTRRLVQYCGGHPSALQILGSSLSRRSIDVWESAKRKMEAIPDSLIHKKLKISFDSLQDDHDKNLFLDISCFFVGKDIDFIITILDECGFYTRAGIQNLIDRCLLTIDENNKLILHQLVQEMGREIVRQESPEEPGKRSRVWHHKDAFNVLTEKSGMETIEGLMLNLHVSEQDRLAKNFFGLGNSKRHRPEDFLDIITLPCGIAKIIANSESQSFPWPYQYTRFLKLPNLLDKLPKELCKMESLKVLHADGAAISQLPSTSSDINLWRSRWFSGVRRPRKSPESISSSLICFPYSLVSLSLEHCNLSDDAIPRDLGSLSLLQDLNLRENPFCNFPESIKGLTMLHSIYTGVEASNCFQSYQ
ncbi:disease resistance protein RPV1-like [Cornus florida]|uniref:disease resistance protein RPV1-like n=1 Tax=Cornus florida TaxID=4283 RepID=UPI00289AE601|nr:disease resistance protein RPV1-like [Cornus florida]